MSRDKTYEEIISLTYTDMINLMNNACRWTKYNEQERYESRLYKLTSDILERHTDDNIAVSDVVNMITEEMLRRKVDGVI